MLNKIKLKRGIIKKVLLLKKSNLNDKIFQTTFSCSLKRKYVQEDLKNAQERLESRKKKKKKIWNITLLIVNALIIVGILIYYALTSGIKSFKELIFENVAYKYLLIALALFIFGIVVDTLKYYQLIKKSTKKKNVVTALNTHLIGRYYDCITPFAVGGQPFQIYYLHKKGLSGSKATSIPLAKHFFSMIAYSIISVGVLISQFITPVTQSTVLIIIAIIALICNVLTVLVILLFSVTKRLGPSLVIKILKLLNKMHIIKNYKTTFFKVARFVKSYQRSMKDFSKSAWTIIVQLVLAVLSYLSIYSIAYFIYLAFLPLNPTPVMVSWADLFCCAVFCDLCASIMPLPGGTGLAEISFDSIFKHLFTLSVFPWALLIWRFLTYFAFVVMGGTKVVCSHIISLCKNKKHNKNEKK